LFTAPLDTNLDHTILCRIPQVTTPVLILG
jgi:hypothetical protein